MTEEDKTFQALTQRLGEMVKENVELTERVKQLMSDYNKVVKQLQAETENPIVTTDLDIDCCDFCILSQGRVYEGNEHLLGTKNKPEVKMKLIDEKRLAELLISEACLELLERNNVDEWDYYEESLRNEVTDGLSYYEYVNQPISEITKDYKTV